MPDPVIAHHQARSIGLATDADLDRVTLSVLEGVRQQVRHDLVDPHPVPSAHDRLALRLDAHECALRLRIAVDDLAYEPAQVDVLDVETKSARHDPRDVEQVVDKARHPLHLLLGAGRVPGESVPGEGLGPGVSSQELDAKLQRRQRRPQLV